MTIPESAQPQKTAIDTNALINLLIAALPELIGYIKTLIGPTASDLTDDQVLLLLNSTIASSLAKDDAWRAAHPSS